MSILTIQPSTADNSTYPASPNSNYGNSASIRCQTGPEIPGYHICRTLISFDFGSLSSYATITNAILYLYFQGDLTGQFPPQGRTYWACRLTETRWTELNSTANAAYDADLDGVNDSGDVFWATFNGDYTQTDKATKVCASNSAGWMDWDVTNQVLYAQANTNKVAHFLMRDETEFMLNAWPIYWYSNNYTGDLTLRPKLVITYSTQSISRRNNIMIF